MTPLYIHTRHIKLCLLAYCLLFSTLLSANGMPFTSLKKSALPPDIKVEGEFINALQWQDKNGQNYVVFSRSSRDDDFTSSSLLHAAGYQVIEHQSRRIWNVRDGIEDCQLDLTSHFVADSIEITDLDHNGVGEVSFVYRKACNGGLDLVGEKLFIIENDKKYPIRGGTQLAFTEEYDGGSYEGPMYIDQSYNRAPKIFKQFGIKKWRRFRES